jgi:hypothetical protein
VAPFLLVLGFWHWPSTLIGWMDGANEEGWPKEGAQLAANFARVPMPKPKQPISRLAFSFCLDPFCLTASFLLPSHFLASLFSLFSLISMCVHFPILCLLSISSCAAISAAGHGRTHQQRSLLTAGLARNGPRGQNAKKSSALR